MTLGQKQRLFTAMVAELIDWAYGQGYELTFGEVYRTKEQQALYVKQDKSQTMNSRHLQRIAVDLNLFVNGKYMTRSEDYKPLGDYWKSLHPLNVWGGDWKTLKDGCHFEMTP